MIADKGFFVSGSYLGQRTPNLPKSALSAEHGPCRSKFYDALRLGIRASMKLIYAVVGMPESPVWLQMHAEPGTEGIRSYLDGGKNRSSFLIGLISPEPTSGRSHSPRFDFRVAG